MKENKKVLQLYFVKKEVTNSVIEEFYPFGDLKSSVAENVLYL